MKVALILAPYDSGHYRSGWGLGPQVLVDGGLMRLLTEAGHDVAVKDIGSVGEGQAREIATGFAVCAAVAQAVREAREAGRFPVVVAGNCLTAIGSVAGGSADSIVWVDQHGDINTPETSVYGLLDGMALATVLGLCWQGMAGSIPRFRPVDPARCLLVDARDLDPAEKALLESLPAARAGCAEAVVAAERLTATGAERVHLHLDLDVHNPADIRANRYDVPGGPTAEELRVMAAGLAEKLPVCGVTLTAYDPSHDPEARMPLLAGRLMAEFLEGLRRHGRTPGDFTEDVR